MVSLIFIIVNVAGAKTVSSPNLLNHVTVAQSLNEVLRLQLKLSQKEMVKYERISTADLEGVVRRKSRIAQGPGTDIFASKVKKVRKFQKLKI